MAVESFVFSTQKLPVHERFGAYHDFYANGSDVGRVDTAFQASVRGYRFSRMLVFDRRISAVRHARTSRVRRDGFDHFTLQLLRSGRLASDIGSSGRVLTPGEILLSDMTRPSGTLLDAAHIVTISLARELVEMASPRSTDLHGLVLPAGPAGLLADFMISLSRRGATLDAEWMAGTPLALASLLKGALSASKTTASPADPVLDAFRLERVQAYIETHLTDPELTVERIACATAFSRTALYRVFEPVGGIVGYIQRRRLARMRASLFRHTERRTIAALAYEHGFVSESHCSRAFRKAYGLPPGQFRNELVQARGTLPPDDAAPKARLASWMHELF